MMPNRNAMRDQASAEVLTPSTLEGAALLFLICPFKTGWVGLFCDDTGLARVGFLSIRAGGALVWDVGWSVEVQLGHSTSLTSSSRPQLGHSVVNISTDCSIENN